MRTCSQILHSLSAIFIISLQSLVATLGALSVFPAAAQQNNPELTNGLAGSAAVLSQTVGRSSSQQLESLQASIDTLNATIPGLVWLNRSGGLSGLSQGLVQSAGAVPVGNKGYLADLQLSTSGFPNSKMSSGIVGATVARSVLVDRVLRAMGLGEEEIEKLSDEDRKGIRKGIEDVIKAKLPSLDAELVRDADVIQGLANALVEHIKSDPLSDADLQTRVLAQVESDSFVSQLKNSMLPIAQDPVLGDLPVVSSVENEIEIPLAPLLTDYETPLPGNDAPLAFGGAGNPVTETSGQPVAGGFSLPIPSEDSLVSESKIAEVLRQPEQPIGSSVVPNLDLNLSNLPKITAPTVSSDRVTNPVTGRGLAGDGEVRAVTSGTGQHSATESVDPVPPPPAAQTATQSSTVASAAKSAAPLSSSNFDSFFVQPSQGAARSTPGVSSSVSHFSNTNPANVMRIPGIPVSASSPPTGNAAELSCHETKPGERKIALGRAFESVGGGKPGSSIERDILNLNRQRGTQIKAISDHYADLYNPRTGSEGGIREFDKAKHKGASPEALEIFEKFLGERSVLKTAEPFILELSRSRPDPCNAQVATSHNAGGTPPDSNENDGQPKKIVERPDPRATAGNSHLCTIVAASRLFDVNGIGLNVPEQGDIETVKTSWISQLKSEKGLTQDKATTAVDGAINTAAIAGLIRMNPEGGPRLMANAFSLAQQMRLNPEDWQCAYTVGGCKDDCFGSNCTRVRDPANPDGSEARIAQLNAFVDELSRFAMVAPEEMQAEFSARAENPLLADAPLPQSKVLQARLSQNLRQNPSGRLLQNRRDGQNLGFSMGTAKLLGSFLGQEKEPSGQAKESDIKKTFVKAVTQCLGDNQWGTVMAEQEVYYRKLAKKLCSEEPNLYLGSDAAFIEDEIAGRRQNTLFPRQDLASLRNSSAQLEAANPSELLGSDFAKGSQSFVVPTIFNSDGGTSNFDVLLNQARSKKASSWIDRAVAGVSSLVDGSLVRGGDPRWLACRAITARHSTYLNLVTANELTKSNWIRVQKDADRRILGQVAPESPGARTPSGH